MKKGHHQRAPREQERAGRSGCKNATGGGVGMRDGYEEEEEEEEEEAAAGRAACPNWQRSSPA